MPYSWTRWPLLDAATKCRLSRYAANYNLLMCRHDAVFKQAADWLATEEAGRLLYVAMNFCGITSKLIADILFQEPIVVGPTDAIRKIWEANNLQTVSWAQAKNCSALGDAVYKVRFGKRHEWSEQAEPIIEPVHPSLFFPVLDPSNVTEMKAAILAWEESENSINSGSSFSTNVGSDFCSSTNFPRYLRREVHVPGKVYQEVYLIDGDQLKQQSLESCPITREAALLGDLMAEVDTGYPGLLVFHVANESNIGEFWGISDYVDIERLNSELNNRISRIGQTLDKHSTPRVILPPGVMKFDNRTGRYYVERSDLEAMEVSPDQAGNLPRYLVWDAKLDAAFQELELLERYIMVSSSTSPAALGLEKGGVAESGRALKFRLLRTLSKVGRTRSYFDAALKGALFAAQVLAIKFGTSAEIGSITAAEPVILEWPDGLPEDVDGNVQREAVAVGAELSSRFSSIQRIYGLTKEQTYAEITRIRDEQALIESPDSTLMTDSQLSQFAQSNQFDQTAQSSFGLSDDALAQRD